MSNLSEYKNQRAMLRKTDVYSDASHKKICYYVPKYTFGTIHDSYEISGSIFFSVVMDKFPKVNLLIPKKDLIFGTEDDVDYDEF